MSYKSIDEVFRKLSKNLYYIVEEREFKKIKKINNGK